MNNNDKNKSNEIIENSNDVTECDTSEALILSEIKNNTKSLYVVIALLFVCVSLLVVNNLGIELGNQSGAISSSQVATGSLLEENSTFQVATSSDEQHVLDSKPSSSGLLLPPTISGKTTNQDTYIFVSHQIRKNVFNVLVKDIVHSTVGMLEAGQLHNSNNFSLYSGYQSVDSGSIFEHEYMNSFNADVLLANSEMNYRRKFTHETRYVRTPMGDIMKINSAFSKLSLDKEKRNVAYMFLAEDWTYADDAKGQMKQRLIDSFHVFKYYDSVTLVIVDESELDYDEYYAMLSEVDSKYLHIDVLRYDDFSMNTMWE